MIIIKVHKMTTRLKRLNETVRHDTRRMVVVSLIVLS